jgi:hypothetical protein
MKTFKESLPSHLARHFDKKGKPIKGEWKDGKWVAKRSMAPSDFKITDVTPKGYGPTDETIEHEYDGKVVKISKKNFSKVHKDFKNSTKGGERMMINDPKTGGSISVPVQFHEESNMDRLKKQLAIHKFKKSGGEIEKQPEGDAYNAMKWRGKTSSTRDEDDENERARNIMAYRKKLRDKKRAKKKK